MQYKKEIEELHKKIENQSKTIQRLEKQLEIQQQESSQKIILQKNEYEEQLSIQQKNKKKIEAQKDEYEKQLSIQAKEIETLKFQKQLQENEINNLKSVPSHQNIEILDSNSYGNIEKLERIGFGSNGEVFKGNIKQSCAIKEINVKSINFDNFRNLISDYELMNMFNHPNVLQSFGIFLGDKTNPPSILLQLCERNLNDAIQSKMLSNSEIVTAIIQIAEGMKYIHLKDIIHRNLKPSNILIDKDGTIKISDFGIAQFASDVESKSIQFVSQKFTAPEILREDEEITANADVYSFGSVLYFILSGGECPKIKTFDICRGKMAEIPTSFSPFSKELIQQCWRFEPEKRPTFKIICQKLKSNWSSLLGFSKKEKDEVQKFIKIYLKKLEGFDK